MGGGSRHARVHWILGATIVAWSVNLSAVKLLTETLDIAIVAAVRMVVAAVFLWLVWRLRRLSAGQLDARMWVWFVVIALLMVYANQMLFASGLARTSATNAALMMALGPFSSLVLESWFFRKRLAVKQLTGVCLAVAGVVLVILHRPGARIAAAGVGDALILASVLSFSCGGLMVQRLARKQPTALISAMTHIVGALVLTANAMYAVEDFTGAIRSIGMWEWSLILYSGVVATGLGALGWSRGIAELGVGQTATYLAWMPVSSAVIGAAVFGETLTAWHVIGMSGVLAGSLLALRATDIESRRRHM